MKCYIHLLFWGILFILLPSIFAKGGDSELLDNVFSQGYDEYYYLKILGPVIGCTPYIQKSIEKRKLC